MAGAPICRHSALDLEVKAARAKDLSNKVTARAEQRRRRDRDTIASLEAERAHAAINMAGLDAQIGELEQLIDCRQHGLGGRDTDTHNLERTKEQTRTRTADIDQALDRDLTARQDRLGLHGRRRGGVGGGACGNAAHCGGFGRR